MSSAGEFTPGKLWSLWDMLKFNASAFYSAISTLRGLQVSLETASDYGAPGVPGDATNAPIDRKICKKIRRDLLTVQEALEVLGARVTNIRLTNLVARLDNERFPITNRIFTEGVGEVHSRLKDEMSLATVFVLEEAKAQFYEPPNPLFGPEVETKFTAATFEIDEAAKCFALSRSTASVFHLMRAMEVGIHAVRACLGIASPAKDWERNWGSILQKIEAEIAARNSASPRRWNGGDKEFFESVYASLDAVRVAWRNTTMHVENKYTDDEAEHIFGAVHGFMRKLASRLDEQGQPLA